ncbi:MAG: hypothetical protein ACRD1N_09565 [Terriglobia bacterium]
MRSEIPAPPLVVLFAGALCIPAPPDLSTLEALLRTRVFVAVALAGFRAVAFRGCPSASAATAALIHRTQIRMRMPRSRSDEQGSDLFSTPEIIQLLSDFEPRI